MTEPLAGPIFRRILIVDDDMPSCEGLRAALTDEGLDVSTADGAPRALKWLSSNVPGMVLISGTLPGTGCEDVCRRLDVDSRMSGVPVVVIADHADDTTIERAAAAGAVDCVTKPFSPVQVRMRIRNLLRQQHVLNEQVRLAKQLSVISAGAKDAIIILDNEGRITHWNKAAETVFGYPRAEALGRNLHALLSPIGMLDAHRAAFPHFRATGSGAAVGKTLELTAVRKSGEVFPIELSLSSALVDNQWCAVGIVRDISARKRLQQAVIASNRFLRTVLDAVPVPVFCKDTTGRFTVVNKAFETLSGFSTDQLIGKTVFDIADPEYAAQSQARDTKLLAHPGTQVYETQMKTPRGDYRDVLFHRAAFSDQDGVAQGIIGVMLDITDRKRMETDLGHARKLEAVGQLAAGIAHEINTPVQYVSDSVHFLHEAFEGRQQLMRLHRQAIEALVASGDQPALIDEIRRVADDVDAEFLAENIPISIDRSLEGMSRIATIVKAMKEFAHPDQREKAPADLNQALRSTLTIARHEYKYVADLDLSLGELPSIVCHVGDLNQVFLNLIVNAAHAIADGVGQTGGRGVIHVATSCEGDTVRIDITDTGTGIPEAIRDRVFDPFFTTKEVGRGSGQGLAIARTIVNDRHRGSLTFMTQTGKGTTFTVRLPVDGTGSERTRELR